MGYVKCSKEKHNLNLGKHLFTLGKIMEKGKLTGQGYLQCKIQWCVCGGGVVNVHKNQIYTPVITS